MSALDEQLRECQERCSRYETALRMIAGELQCADSLMSNQDIARAALQAR